MTNEIKFPYSIKYHAGKFLLPFIFSLVASLAILVSIVFNKQADYANYFLQGGIAVFLFALGLMGTITAIRKIKSPVAPIAVDEKGITDHLSLVPVGCVPWRDITGVHEVGGVRDRTVFITLNNPELYVYSRNHLGQKAVKEAIIRAYGEGIFISTKNLQCTNEQLLAIVIEGVSRFDGREI